MTTAKQDAMIWMNNNFGSSIATAVRGTPIRKELLIAIGIQETYYIWAKMYKNSTPEQVLAICVGDTIDYPRRSSAWPKNRQELEAAADGKAMFKIARQALVDLAQINAGYRKSLANPDKFCHGYGMFQYDIQFFKKNRRFFLDRTWATWDGTLSHGMAELKDQLADLYGPKNQLSHDESVYLAISYNQGAKKTKANMASKKFKQGYKDGDLYYGEHIDENLRAMKGLW